ncbi:hypothetical protein AVEN_124483-1 [Araneus ventricosus]|uniref:Uncharacterized protein n=1 Tax=Araneus ventricosus TaxID=182803 RepID=A0A4Y2KR66_ARAVE|nr:hypothetical protein AVEN_124483-1 [Araneus ventricosus]
MPLHVSIKDTEDEIFNGIRELQTCDLLYLLLSRHEKTERTKQLMDTLKLVAANINDGTRQFSQTANNDIVPHPKRFGSAQTFNANKMMDTEQSLEETVAEIHEIPNEEKTNQINEKQLNNRKIVSNPAIYTGPQTIQNQ